MNPEPLHERVVTLGLAGCALLVGLFAPLSFNAVAPAVLLMGLLVATRRSLWRDGVRRFLLRPDRLDPLVRANFWFLVFAFAIAVAGVWAPREDAARLALNVALPVVAGGAVIAEILRRPRGGTLLLARAFAFAFAAAILLLLFEALTGGLLHALAPPHDPSPERIKEWVAIGRGATIVALSFFALAAVIDALTTASGDTSGSPAAAAGSLPVAPDKRKTGVHFFARRSGPLINAALFSATLVAAVLLGVASNVAALLAGAAAFAAGRAAPNRTLAVLTGLALAALLLAPLAVFLPAEAIFAAGGGGLDASWLQRLVIWKESARAAIDCMPFGCGPDAARTIGEGLERVRVPGAPVPLPALSVHPHSLFLQIWLELGLAGVVAFAAFLLNLGAAAMRAPMGRIEKAAIAATLAAHLVSAMLELSLWQAWRIAIPMLAGMLIALAHRRRERDR